MTDQQFEEAWNRFIRLNLIDDKPPVNFLGSIESYKKTLKLAYVENLPAVGQTACGNAVQPVSLNPSREAVCSMDSTDESQSRDYVESIDVAAPRTANGSLRCWWESLKSCLR